MTSISWGLYLILAAINVLAFIFVRYCLGEYHQLSDGYIQQIHNLGELPSTHANMTLSTTVETRGKTLEEMAHLFGIEEDHGNEQNKQAAGERRELLRDDPAEDVVDIEDEP